MSLTRHKRIRRGAESIELNMTAMCDVIFQLLIYLILTASPPIVYASLAVNRPAPDKDAPPRPPTLQMVEIMVLKDEVTVLGKKVTSATLKTTCRDLAAMDTNQTVIIKCAWDSPHEKLVEVLDTCSSNKLANLSVMSM